MKRTAAIVISLLSVLAGSSSTNSASLYNVVADQLVQRYALDTSKNKVEILKGQLADGEIDPADVVIQPLFQREPIGLVSVVVIVSDADGGARRGQFNLRVRRLAEVLVMAASMKLHEEMAADKVETRRMDVTSLREQPITSFDAIHGSRTKRNLAVGQILTAEAIESAPDIEVGREVTIIFAGNAFTVSTRGQAMQTGRRGEIIRVRNRASGKTLLARVTGEGEVRLEL